MCLEQCQACSKNLTRVRSLNILILYCSRLGCLRSLNDSVAGIQFVTGLGAAEGS